MIALIVKDMPMPASCSKCDFSTGAFCKRTYQNIDYTQREKHCPLDTINYDPIGNYNEGYKDGLEQARKETFKDLYEKLVEEIRTSERKKILEEIKHHFTVDDYPVNDEK